MIRKPILMSLKVKRKSKLAMGDLKSRVLMVRDLMARELMARELMARRRRQTTTRF